MDGNFDLELVCTASKNRLLRVPSRFELNDAEFIEFPQVAVDAFVIAVYCCCHVTDTFWLLFYDCSQQLQVFLAHQASEVVEFREVDLSHWLVVFPVGCSSEGFASAFVKRFVKVRDAKRGRGFIRWHWVHHQ